GDGISPLRFVSVCFEDGANAAHRVRTPGAGWQKNAGSFCRVVLDAHVFSQVTFHACVQVNRTRMTRIERINADKTRISAGENQLTFLAFQAGLRKLKDQWEVL